MSNENVKLMAEISQTIINVIQSRQSSRVKALTALASSPMDNIPDEVKKMREIEAAKIRAVMQEQDDLIDICKMLFPQVATSNKQVKKKDNNA